MSPHPYAAAVLERLTEAVEQQDAVLRSTAVAVAERVRAGGVLHVFGTGHSHLITEELFSRAGGTTFVSPVFDPAVMVTAGAGRSSRTERLHGYAESVLAGVDLRPGDAFLVVSNSGRNPVPIEAALYARERGCLVIGLVSAQHAASVTSRHTSGQLLTDVVDVVLDSHAPAGDAAVEIPGTEDRYGPTSTILCATLAHTLTCLVVDELVRTGDEPPVLRSANADGTDEVNRRRKARYAGRIPALPAPTPPNN